MGERIARGNYGHECGSRRAANSERVAKSYIDLGSMQLGIECQRPPGKRISGSRVRSTESIRLTLGEIS